MSIIKAIFFARFHLAKGPHILHQIPSDAIVKTEKSNHEVEKNSLFDFSAISNLIIPSQEFCNRLITVCINGYRVIAYPVCIESSKYERNLFIFNFALVLDEAEEFGGYTTIIRKLALLFRNLEEQTSFLSNDEADVKSSREKVQNLTVILSNEKQDQENNDDDDVDNYDNDDDDDDDDPYHVNYRVKRKVFSLCEMMFEDLNHYQECMIPIDESNTINLKIFPTRPPPPPIYDWHVPLSTVQLNLLSTSSDLTLTRIIPCIDGVRSVLQISQLADTDRKLTKKAIAHLVYYGCIILLDIFQYSAIYAPTAEISSFVQDVKAQEEAVRYMSIDKYKKSDSNSTWLIDESAISTSELVQLYLSLRQGLPLKTWCIEHNTLLLGVDVRRFITYGVMKGFLYRVHKYAILDGSIATANEKDEILFDVDRIENWRNLNTKKSFSFGGFDSHIRDIPLVKYLDGMHSFDEICTELQIGDKDISERMKEIYKNVTFIYK